MHPDATFTEIEAACFPGLDGRAEMTAISPRLFDAAMLGTAQILIEDDYLRVLEPWEHYIPTNSSVSNIDEIADALRNLALLEQLTEATRDALIGSGEFSYQGFVERVFAETVSGSGIRRPLRDSPDSAGELQWRLNEDLFEALQRITYLSWATGSGDALIELVYRIDSALTDHPALTAHLGEELLAELTYVPPISPAIDRHLGPIIDVFVECFRAGALSLVAQWLTQSNNGEFTEWQMMGWTEQDRIVLDGPEGN